MFFCSTNRNPQPPSHFISLSLFCLLCFPRRPKFSFPSVHAAAVPVPLLLPYFSLSSWNLTSLFSLLARVLVVTCRRCYRLDLSFVAVSSCSPELRRSCANLPFSSTSVAALPVLLCTAASRAQFVVAGAAGGFLSAATVLLSFHSCSWPVVLRTPTVGAWSLVVSSLPYRACYPLLQVSRGKPPHFSIWFLIRVHKYEAQVDVIVVVAIVCCCCCCIVLIGVVISGFNVPLLLDVVFVV